MTGGTNTQHTVERGREVLLPSAFLQCAVCPVIQRRRELAFLNRAYKRNGRKKCTNETLRNKFIYKDLQHRNKASKGKCST